MIFQLPSFKWSSKKHSGTQPYILLTLSQARIQRGRAGSAPSPCASRVRPKMRPAEGSSARLVPPPLKVRTLTDILDPHLQACRHVPPVATPYGWTDSKPVVWVIGEVGTLTACRMLEAAEQIQFAREQVSTAKLIVRTELHYL